MTRTSIEWAAAINALGHDLACSGGEALLRIAASLAQGIPVDLRDAITGLDHTNTALVARAITQAARHRSRQTGHIYTFQMVQRMPCSDTVAVLVTTRHCDHRNASVNASAEAMAGPCPAACQPSSQRRNGV